jgi:ATP-binding cassette subfamily F protein 3
MTVLVVENLGKSYGARRVFAGVSFTIGRGERAGLVGPNGSGKTTLLETITGRLIPDEGRVNLVGRPRLGYLEQETGLLGGGEGDLMTYVLGAMAGLTGREDRLRAIELEMASLRPDSPELASLMDEYGALRDAFEREGGYTKEARVREVLFGLGFGEEHMDLPLERLSAGQRTRARLGRLLLEEPDLLMLDEPTNHLDLEAVEWLEEFLQGYAGAVLAVAHDRYFLDRTAQKILELESGRLVSWTGNYTAYATQKEEWLVQAREAYERQKVEIERLEDYVRRYKAGNRSTMAKSREKALARMDRIEKPPGAKRSAKLHFTSEHMSGREVLRLEGVGLAFDDGDVGEGRGDLSWLFRNVTASARRGRRVALVGRNGTGKTTLLQVAVGRRQATSGRVVWGHNVKVAYFSQGLDELDDSRTVLEEIMAVTGFDIPTSRSYLGRFLFSGEDVFKPVSVLSGGERNRLVLACLISTNPNVLVLDEPTNHLDLQAREALERALQEFPGTVIFVSHDRYFVERLATRIWELDAGALVEFAGGYREYRLWQAHERLRQPAEPAGAEPPGQPGPAPEEAGEAQTPRLSKGRRDRLLRELESIEKLVERLERRRGELESLMADPDSYRQGAGADLGTEYRAVLEDLEKALARWEELGRAVDG